MTENTVVLKALSIGYKTKKGVHVVASDLTADIKRGELTCLLGENGVGKSTLLRTLSNFQPKLHGEITIENRPLEDFSDKELAKMIGVVLTEKPDVGQMTVTDLVSLGRSPYTGFWGVTDAEDRQIVDEAIRQAGITHLKQRQVMTLSDGERQKVMIAKALAQQTPVIFLDEPTAFLDYPSKVEMLMLLKRTSREADKTVFLSTHDVELALQVADRLWLMSSRSVDRLSRSVEGEVRSENRRSESGVALQIGTPHELAAKGVLAQFVERGNGIHFDADTLSIRVEQDYS